MTEPYHIDAPETLQNIPSDLRFILESFQEYKKSVIHPLTLKDQKPVNVQDIKRRIAAVGQHLLNMLSGQQPSLQDSNSNIAHLFQSLEPPFRTLTDRKRTVLRRWIELTFFHNPMTILPSHVNNLAKQWLEENLQPQQNVHPDAEIQADESWQMP